MENLKVWKKDEFEGMTYYCLIHAPYVNKIVDKKTLKIKEVEDFVEAKGFLYKDWGPYLHLQSPGKENQEGVELPPGSYVLKSHDGGPTRLEVMTLRDEGYTPLDDHETLVQDISRFLQSKEIYDHLQFIYKRGYLLYGEPGTGKTAFIRYLSQQEIFKKAHIVWMPFVPQAEISQALNKIQGLKVLVMEELIDQTGHLSYDMKRLLEFMDGEQSIKNCITIGTTNYPAFLHKNLADRPSRFDVLFEMKNQPQKVVQSVLEKWLQRDLKEGEVDFASVSLAHLKEIVLLHKFFNISLKDAAKKLHDQSKKFEKGFEKKNELGLGGIGLSRE